METVAGAVGVGVGCGLGEEVGEDWGPPFADDSKLGITVPGPFIVAVVEEEEVLEITIDPDLVHDVKEKPELATVDIGTAAPASYQLAPEGLTVPSVALIEKVT
jgi:hypothetical protein